LGVFTKGTDIWVLGRIGIRKERKAGERGKGSERV